MSIRDQILRAHYLIERLFETGYLTSSSTIMVIGAGAAGVTTAILAARLGVTVHLVELLRRPFRFQQVCTTRWIDPVQYDWPARHSNQKQWPLGTLGFAVPLGFKAGPASTIASDWLKTLATHRLALPQLHLHVASKMISASTLIGPTHQRAAVLKSRHVPGTTTIACDAIINTRGVLKERTNAPFHPSPAPSKPEFIGPRFWSNDGYERLGFGLSNTTNRNVLVSGSGDGALQDYIRLVTGYGSAIDVLTAVFGAMPHGTVLQRSLRAVIMDAESEASRAAHWNATEAHDHATLQRIHDVHVACINTIKSSSPDWLAAVKELARMTVGRHPERVLIAHGCSHFSGSYALNRFLVLMLGAFVEEHHKVASPILSKTRLRAVRPLASRAGNYLHTCLPECWGHEHEVELESGIVCGVPSGSGLTTRHVCDGVVVHHGIIAGTGRALVRHILPLHLP